MKVEVSQKKGLFVPVGIHITWESEDGLNKWARVMNHKAVTTYLDCRELHIKLSNLKTESLEHTSDLNKMFNNTIY